MTCRNCGSDDLVYDSDGIPECMKCGFRDEDDDGVAPAKPASGDEPNEGFTGCFDDMPAQ